MMLSRFLNSFILKANGGLFSRKGFFSPGLLVAP